MTHSRRAKSPKQSIVLITLALAGLASTIGTVASSGALFTDSQTVGANAFSTGTVLISPEKTGSTQLSLSNMAPGDVQYGEVTVANTGSLSLRYAISQSATDPDGKALAQGLDLDVRAGVSSCDSAGWASGTLLTQPDQKFNEQTVVGSDQSGAQPGDRTVPAATEETLCFRVTLPLSAPNSLQGSTTTGTFTFSAEQTKNN